MAALRDAITSTIEDFCNLTGMSADALGRKAVGDHHLVARIRKGRVTLPRLEKLEAFMRGERRRLAASRAVG